MNKSSPANTYAGPVAVRENCLVNTEDSRHLQELVYQRLGEKRHCYYETESGDEDSDDEVMQPQAKLFDPDTFYK